jgi:hypothetical protein
MAIGASLAGSVLAGSVGAAEESQSAIECEGDSCQVLPPAPEEPTLGTAMLTSEVNPKPSYGKPRKAKKRRYRHRHHSKRSGSSRTSPR